MTTRGAGEAPRATGHLVRSESWNGLRAGDPVVVDGLRMRGAAWTFRAHVVNERSGAEHVEVVGGRPGDRKIRCFPPGRVYAVRSGRSSRGGHAGPERRAGSGPAPSTRASTVGQLSLAEAPQLPLG